MAVSLALLPCLDKWLGWRRANRFELSGGGRAKRGGYYTRGHAAHQGGLSAPDFTMLMTCAAGTIVTISKDAV